MADIAPGFFGKLPSHGDFIDRGLPRAFIAPWDAWLLQALAESRRYLGEVWLEHYMVAPLWRFVVAPGICGEEAWQGVLMPSVDRVNRHFPLTLAAARAPGTGLVQALLGNEPWFARCEAIALEALTTGMEADALLARLARVAAPPPQPACYLQAAAGPLAWQLPWPAGTGGAGPAAVLAEALLGQLGMPLTLWSTEGSERLGPCLLVHRGLPDGAAFTALLDGDFTGWGWDGCHFPLAPDAAEPGPDDQGGVAP